MIIAALSSCSQPFTKKVSALAVKQCVHATVLRITKITPNKVLTDSSYS